MSHSPRLLVFLSQSTACSSLGLCLWGGISLQCYQNSSEPPFQRTLHRITQSSVTEPLRTYRNSNRKNIGQWPDKNVYFHHGTVSRVSNSYQMLNRLACTIELLILVRGYLQSLLIAQIKFKPESTSLERYMCVVTSIFSFPLAVDEIKFQRFWKYFVCLIGPTHSEVNVKGT